MNPSNLTPQDQQFLVKTDSAPTVWVKPQLTKTPLREALSGFAGNADGQTTGVLGNPYPGS